MGLRKQRENKLEVYGRSPVFDVMGDLKNLAKLGGKAIKRRTGAKFIKEFPRGEPIVSMIGFKGRILVATTRMIYELKEDKVIPIKIKMEK